MEGRLMSLLLIMQPFALAQGLPRTTPPHKLELKTMAYPGVQVQTQDLKKVPKPEVVVDPPTCSPLSDTCVLSCDGNTEGAGQVTYSWREGDGQWVQDGQQKVIENNDKTKRVGSFSCQMENRVSMQESDPCHNPFFKTKLQIWEFVILILFLCVCAYVVWIKRGTARRRPG